MDKLTAPLQFKSSLKAFVLVAMTMCLTVFGALEVRAQAASCRSIYTVQSVAAVRTYEQIKELKMMAFNVENLFWSTGKVEWVEPGVQRRNLDEPSQQKPEKETEKIRSIIAEESPDILIITEVESLVALEHLAAQGLQGKYRALLIEGNDSRGIDIGFLVKTDLPFLIENQTHKDFMWQDPITRKPVKLFSRDLPTLLFRRSANEAPFFILAGNHAKSKRDRPGDPESNLWRKAQYEAIAQIISDYRTQFPNTLVALGGDFNTRVNNSPEVSPLKDILKSGFLMTANATPIQDRITHTYHPRNGPTEKSQMDDIQFSPGFEGAVIEARVYRYKNADGTIMPFANSFEERGRQPSDHLPVIMRISTRPLF